MQVNVKTQTGVEFFNHYVKDDQIRLLFIGNIQTFLYCFTGQDLIAFLLQDASHRKQKIRVVIYVQNTNNIGSPLGLKLFAI